jgi:hypothetical protein
VPCDLDGTKSIAWQVALVGRDGSNGSRGRKALSRIVLNRIEATKSRRILFHRVS